MKKCILFQKSDAFRCFVLLVYWEDEKAYSADGNGADKRSAEKGGNLVSKFTDLQGAGGGAGFGQEGGNYNGLGWGRLAVIDWLMAAAPGQRITFFGPNSGTQCPPPQIPLPDHPLFATFTFTSLSLSSFLLLLYLSLSSLDPILACNKNTTPSPIMIIPP